jgi:SAM-dependent methyltransferase
MNAKILETEILDENEVKADLREYYGETLQGSQDLQTNACCDTDQMPGYIKDCLSDVHDEVLMRYYGCGLVVPSELEGKTILDLGCGAGRDVYVLSKLVGEHGKVIGVDMTPEQLAVARSHQAYHADKFGHAKSNVEFYEGDIEKLDALALAAGSIDIIVSNCVINLAHDKRAVLEQAHRLLKEGGEMYFSDVYADRRIPLALQQDKVLYGECLSGAMYWNDFQNLSRQVGFFDPRIVEDRRLTIENPELEARIGNIKFYSVTYRLFKLAGLEPACEDYGQSVVYKGSIPHQANAFFLDAHHFIETGKQFPVCGNTYDMLKQTRFATHFEFYGDRNKHFGIFQGCGTDVPYAAASEAGNAASSNCC